MGSLKGSKRRCEASSRRQSEWRAPTCGSPYQMLASHRRLLPFKEPRVPDRVPYSTVYTTIQAFEDELRIVYVMIDELGAPRAWRSLLHAKHAEIRRDAATLSSGPSLTRVALCSTRTRICENTGICSRKRSIWTDSTCAARLYV